MIPLPTRPKLQSSHHFPLGGIYLSKRNEAGIVIETDVDGLLSEPERQEALGGISFLFGALPPFDPPMPYGIDLGPESKAPEAIENGAIMHPDHKSLQ
jgi:hypothetical protein